MTSLLDWIAVDWGGSQLRAWAIKDDVAVATARSESGMAGLAPEEFEPALLSLIDSWLGPGRTTVLACGMVGARQGWSEAPYRPAPCPPHGGGATTAPAANPRLAVRILPGVSQSRPPDVMRGEETQIAGFLAAAPRFDGVICLPGTHTKWVHVSAGEIVSFRTFMTGELFALLTGRSVLRHAVGDGWDGAAFADAVSDAMSRPEEVAARLFGIRAESLLSDLGPAAARARISGLLIGMELAAARVYWLGRDLALIGESGLSAAYRAALEAQGAPVRTEDAEAATLRGLIAARRTVGETP